MPSPSQFLRDLVALLKSLCKALRGESKQPPCAACPPALKKPDPFLYSQQYLMSLGLPVTWDNPDIYIYEGGTLVDPHDLRAGTDYTVIARAWNNSVPPRARWSLSTDNWRPEGWCRFRPPR